MQPNINVVTSLPTIGELVFGNQISITPNPSWDQVKMLFRMQSPGAATIAIYNSASQLYKKLDLSASEFLSPKTIVLANLPAGVYFFHVMFKSFNGQVQNGMYKIVRL